MSLGKSTEGVLLEMVSFIEGIFKHTTPAVMQAVAAAAPGMAAAALESDPRAQAITAAGVAVLQATQQLKTAINTPAVPPTA